MATQSADLDISSPVLPIHGGIEIPTEVRDTAARLGVAQYFDAVANLTCEVYGGFSDITVSDDSEFGDTQIIFHCPVNCPVEESLAMDEEWGRRILKIIPRSPQGYMVFAEFPR